MLNNDKDNENIKLLKKTYVQSNIHGQWCHHFGQ